MPRFGFLRATARRWLQLRVSAFPSPRFAGRTTPIFAPFRASTRRRLHYARRRWSPPGRSPRRWHFIAYLRSAAPPRRWRRYASPRRSAMGPAPPFGDAHRTAGGATTTLRVQGPSTLRPAARRKAWPASRGVSRMSLGTASLCRRRLATDLSAVRRHRSSALRWHRFSAQFATFRGIAWLRNAGSATRRMSLPGSVSPGGFDASPFRAPLASQVSSWDRNGSLRIAGLAICRNAPPGWTTRGWRGITAGWTSHRKTRVR